MKIKNITIGSAIVVLSLLAIPINLHNANALTYQDSSDIQFTFNSEVNINLGGNLIISNLPPGSAADSNIIDVTVGSNSVAGYKLYATVGNTTNASTALKNGNFEIPSLSATRATINNFSGSEWGYSYSTDDGTTWVNGDTGSTTTGYGVLPIYTETGTKLAEVNSASSTSLKFKIGASAISSQAAGTYTNTVNFYAVVNPVSDPGNQEP